MYLGHYPANTQRDYNAITTSLQSHGVATTLYRRCDVMCLLGNLINDDNRLGGTKPDILSINDK